MVTHLKKLEGALAKTVLQFQRKFVIILLNEKAVHGDKPTMLVLYGLAVKNLRYATIRLAKQRSVAFATSAIIFVIVLLKKNAGNWTNHPMYAMDVISLKKCTLRKKFYVAKDAQDEYEYVRSEARTGIAITESELNQLDQLITPLIKNGQSFIIYV